jgi:Restriction endonuclease
MDSSAFEHLIRTVLLTLGAEQARVIPHSQDKGADVVATFRLAGAFQQVVAVQAKYWKSEPPVGPEVVEHLVRGIVAEGADLGLVVTTGSISEEATLAAKKIGRGKWCQDRIGRRRTVRQADSRTWDSQSRRPKASSLTPNQTAQNQPRRSGAAGVSVQISCISWNSI